MKRIDLTETEKKVISGEKTNISNSHKRNIHMSARRKAVRMVENLKFLAEHLPEAQQKQIFSPETVSNLVNKILTYRKVPKQGGEKLPKTRGEKIPITEEEAKILHDVYIGIPKAHTNWPKRLPRVFYNAMKSLTPTKQWDPKKIWLGKGGARFPHPSLKRQIELSIKILEKTYLQILQKLDAEKISRKLIQDLYPVLYFDCVDNGIWAWSKESWISNLLRTAPYEDWSEKVIDDWLKQVNLAKGEISDPILKQQLQQLLSRWIIKISYARIKQIQNDRILVVHTFKS